MNNRMKPEGDPKLVKLLRESRPAPSLPPRFREAVWRRIERAPSHSRSLPFAERLDRAAAWLLRPYRAMAVVAAMILVGVALGIAQGTSGANELAKRQYIAAVSPLNPQ